MSLSISSAASTPSDFATVNCSGSALAAASTESDVKVVMNAPLPMDLACRIAARRGRKSKSTPERKGREDEDGETPPVPPSQACRVRILPP